MLEILVIVTVLAPLLGCLITGLGNKHLPKSVAHWLTCSLVGLSFSLSVFILWQLLLNNISQISYTLYSWLAFGALDIHIGFLIDRLSALMMVTVTFVSFMVHIYTIGYMRDDDGYQRFFSYLSLFTFAMLMLVMADNFVQLFFGWEGVGLVSYLLIGFWFKKESAIFANLKAFIVNRVGDLGFILGIAAVFMYFGSFNYHEIFTKVPQFTGQNIVIELLPGLYTPALTLICICLFIGAMAKSAQIPLHVWLPDSMEGPTPISALIHAATMVTAGVFMVARMSPLFEYSIEARSFVLVIGATTALLMGLLGLVQSDIKRIIAYSTLSQLGYMVTALGASVYSIAIFHLFTHAFFKALLFLAAGSVIIGLHHEQDIWKMGNIRKYMPITYWTSLFGSLALVGFPFFSGFYSKDLIIEAVREITIPGASFAYFAVVFSVFITALYSFRLFFVVFHTEERMSEATRSHLHESPAVVWVPLVLLAIPSVIIGAIVVEYFVFDQSSGGFFQTSLTVLQQNNVIAKHLNHEFTNWFMMGLGSLQHLPFWLMLSGIFTAYLFYVKKPLLANYTANKFKIFHQLLVYKYGFDIFNERIIAPITRKFSNILANQIDLGLIDAGLVNGTAISIGRISALLKRLQTGYLYNYIFFMVLGLLLLILLVIL